MAALFVGLGALQPGLQTHYADTEMAIVWLAAIVASPRWVLACVAVCVAGAIGDQAAAERLRGHSSHTRDARREHSRAVKLLLLL